MWLSIHRPHHIYCLPNNLSFFLVHSQLLQALLAYSRVLYYCTSIFKKKYARQLVIQVLHQVRILGTFYRYLLVIWLWTSMPFVFMLVIQGWTYCYNTFWLEWWMTNHPKIMLLFLTKKKRSCYRCLITHNPQAYLTTRTTAATTRESISYQRSYRFGPWNSIFRYRLIPIYLFGFTAIYILIYIYGKI